MVGRRTCDQEVASSIPGRARLRNDSGQVVHTQLPRRWHSSLVYSVVKTGYLYLLSCWLIERELDNCIFLNCDRAAKWYPGTLFTIGRTTVFLAHASRKTSVRHASKGMRGYSRCTSYVRRPCAGRKFGRKSTTPTEMSYDLLSYAYIWKTFLFLPFVSFLVVYTELTSFYTSPQHI